MSLKLKKLTLHFAIAGCMSVAFCAQADVKIGGPPLRPVEMAIPRDVLGRCDHFTLPRWVRPTLGLPYQMSLSLHPI